MPKAPDDVTECAGLAQAPRPSPVLLVAARVMIALEAPPMFMFGLVVALVGWATSRTPSAFPGTAITGLLLIVGCIVVPFWSFLAAFLPQRWALPFIALLQGVVVAGAVTWVAQHPTSDATPVGYFALLPAAVLALVVFPGGSRKYFKW